jgi:hypothetical protein
MIAKEWVVCDCKHRYTLSAKAELLATVNAVQVIILKLLLLLLVVVVVVVWKNVLLINSICI